jgi:methanogenic corrinoid protein MtbC1
MVAGLLRQRGIRVHFLGASVPTVFLVESVRMRQPSVILLSVTLEENRPALLRASEVLRAALTDAQPTIVFGGHLEEAWFGANTDGGMLATGSLESVLETILSLVPPA